MRTKIVRVAEGKQSTLSHLYIDGIFQCFLLEDKIRAVKIMKQTAIPTGEFYLTLNTWGGKNKDYANKFPVMHRGTPFQKSSATNVKIINTILYVCQHEKIQEIIPS